MKLDATETDSEAIAGRLRLLFEAAKAADEFELACTLLRVRGMEDAGWDPFVETHLLVQDLTTLISAPLQEHTQIRLGLLLYSHLTEVGAIYEMLANLANVIAGERYSIDPFIPHYSRNRKGDVQFLSTPRKVGVLKEMFAEVDRADIVELLDWYFNPAIRNSFAHADYTLHQDKFRSRSERFEVDGIITSELPLQALVEVFNRALAFFEAFVTEYERERRSYTANKRITGRIAGDEQQVPVELLADPLHGLYGLRSPPQEDARRARREGAAGLGVGVCLADLYAEQGAGVLDVALILAADDSREAHRDRQHTRDPIVGGRWVGARVLALNPL